jgi:hypothetical protein
MTFREKPRRLLRLVLQPFRGSAPGATLVEYLIVVGFCALCGIVAFTRYGSTLQRELRAEARYIKGDGLPNAADLLGSLGGLANSDDTCPGGICVPGSGFCFAAGTVVASETGDRPIEAVRAGDRVWAGDMRTGAVALRPVLRTFITERAPVLELELVAGTLFSERLRVTPGHRFWVEDRGWLRADELSAEPLWSTDASVFASVLPAEPVITTVYNLEVEEFHTYFVGRSHALVHNQNSTPGPNDCPPTNQNARRPQFTPQQIAACTQAFAEKHPGGFGSRTRRDNRPADAADQLCQQKLADCRLADDKEACEKKWDCIYEHVASHPRTNYFDSLPGKNSNGNAQGSAKLQQQCSSDRPEEYACYKGDATSVPTSSLPPEEAQVVRDAARRRDAATDPQEKRRASEEAGEAAALGHAKSQHPGWSCNSYRGSRVFDVVCVNDATGEVAIYEAKGGNSDLGVRWDKDMERRVQQGSLPYVEAVANDMAKSNPELADRIRESLEDKTLIYRRVQQPFDGSNPGDISVRDFKLDGCPRR